MNLFKHDPTGFQDVAFLQQWIRDLQETAYYRAELCIVLKEKSEILKSLIEKHEEYRSQVEGKNEELRHKVVELNSALLLNSERGSLRLNQHELIIRAERKEQTDLLKERIAQHESGAVHSHHLRVN